MTPAAARLIGLAGSTTIAASAWLAGAGQTGQPGPLSWQRLTGDGRYAAGCLAWLVGIAVLSVAWWACRRPPGPRWIAITTALWTLPIAVSPPIGSRDVYAYANQGRLLLSGGDPYRDGPAALPTDWLPQMDAYWQAEPAPYGPVFLVLAAGVAAAAGGSLTVAVIGFRVVALLALLATAWSVAALAKRCGVSPGAAWWLAAAAPLTLTQLAGGVHNDALMVAGTVACLAVAATGRRWTAGLILGAAVAVKVTAIVVAPFAVLLLMTGPFGWRRFGAAAARFGAALVGCFAVVTVASGLGLGWVAALGTAGKSVSWLSLPTGWGVAAGKALLRLGADPGLVEAMVPLWRAAALAAAAVVVVVLWWRARDGSPRTIVAAAGWAATAVVLAGPVLLPWYPLLPLALVAASAIDDRVVTGWAVAVTALVVVVLPDGHNVAAEWWFTPGLWLDVALAVAAVGWLLWHRRRRRTPIGP